ncbi:MAG: DUF5063 domain-containing protein [Lentisphaerales bacterium]|nr:DUF5063 domain-containing protein [Lentisphaerales bacterium]
MSEQLENFYAAAQSFKNLVKAEPVEKTKEAVSALNSLSLLYSSAIQLMTVEAGREEPEGDESFAVCVDEWNDVYERLNNMPFTYYSELESPLDSNSESSYTDLIEDLTDIYQDVVEGLNIYEAGLKEQALCHWQMTFEFHWGRHLLGAMTALHCYFQDEGDFASFL